jgi:hypothetical protein
MVYPELFLGKNSLTFNMQIQIFLYTGFQPSQIWLAGFKPPKSLKFVHNNIFSGINFDK